MSQQDELARVKVRIKALVERTVDRGCTDAEAMAAAEMVGRLLERYALTMDAIDVRQTPCVEARVPAGGLRRRPIDTCVPGDRPLLRLQGVVGTGAGATELCVLRL